MPRNVIDVDITTKTARKRLKPRGKPYFRALGPSLHIGYRRLAEGRCPWVERFVEGNAYKTQNIGAWADDNRAADGIDCLRYEQAAALIRARAANRDTDAKQRIRAEQHKEERRAAGLPVRNGPFHVEDCLKDYKDGLENEGRKRLAYEFGQKAKRILETFRGVELHPCLRLTTPVLNAWLDDLANSPPRVGTRGASDKADAELVEQIRDVLKTQHPFKPGHHKLHTLLKTRGVRVGLNRVLRVMRDYGLLSRRREEEVTAAIALAQEGLCLAAIGRRIGRTPKTVKKYLTQGYSPPHPNSPGPQELPPIDPTTGMRLRPIRFRKPKADEDPEITRRKRENTANSIRQAFLAALYASWRNGDIDRDAVTIWQSMKRFRDTRGVKQDYLRKHEILALLKGAEPEPEFRDFIQGHLSCPTRVSEVTRMRVRDFDSERGSISIHYSKTDRKTGKRGRVIHLNVEGAAFFRHMTAGRAGYELIFQRPEGGAWKADNHLPLGRAAKRGGIERHISMGIFRHTWASHAVMARIDYTAIADQMGHMTPEMVQKVYGHLDPKWVEEQAKNAPTYGIAPRTPAAVATLQPDARAA